MKLEVKHSPFSENYIKDTFSRYKEIDELPNKIEGRCIIHVYPIADTILENGNLTGYKDAYDCELHIYDVDNKTVYKTKRHDEVVLDVPCHTRIFKDLSTMVVIDKPVHFMNGHSFFVLEKHDND